MRPGVERLAEHRIPRPVGVALHYLAARVLALLLWLVVPRAIDQVDQAIGGVPTSQQELNQKAKHSTGIKHEFFVGLQKRLQKLPSAGNVVHMSVTSGRRRSRRSSGSSSSSPPPPTGSSSATRRSSSSPRSMARDRTARSRHVGADRREARRVRARPAAADRLRGDDALARLLADRRAVLAAARALRRDRGDRPRDRPARGRAVAVGAG